MGLAVMYATIKCKDRSSARYVIKLASNRSKLLKSCLNLGSKLVDDEPEPSAVLPILLALTATTDSVFTLVPTPVILIAKPQRSCKDGLSNL